MKILAAKTENMGYYSLFHYQIVNSGGAPLTGSGYGVEEHIVGGQPGARILTSEGVFRAAVRGQVVDYVGFQSMPEKTVIYRLMIYQGFTVRYHGTDYNLPTVFKHVTQAVDGIVTNSVTDETP